MVQIRNKGIPDYQSPSESQDMLDEEDTLDGETDRATSRFFDVAALVLCAAGVGISGYLTYSHYADTRIACITGNSCDIVNRSSYAFFLGIPVALLGLLFYLSLLAAVTSRALLNNPYTSKGLLWRGRLDLLLFLMGLSGVAFTAYLKAMEIFVIGHICAWCVGSALTVTILFVLFVIRLLKA